MNGRNMISSLFAMLAGLFTSTTKLVRTVDESIDMLDVAVSDAKTRQVVRSGADMAQYEAMYAAEAAQRLDEARRKAREYMAKSEAHYQGYEKAYAEIKEAIAKRKAQLTGKAISDDNA